MQFRKRKRGLSSAAFDVTPLVDIMFLLQIFFLLTLGTPLKLNQVSLPETSSGDSLTREAVTVSISEKEILINGHDAREDELKALPKDKDIVILASKSIPYFRVVAMLDILRSSGHERISLATRPIKG
jgi:biopolymer transport protein ExbD